MTSICSGLKKVIAWTIVTVLASYVGLFIRGRIEEYTDVNMTCGDRESFPLEYELLYRAKQHAQRCGKLGFITHSRYFSLEKSLVDCRRGNKASCMEAVTSTDFLNNPASNEQIGGAIKLLVGLLSKILLPQRRSGALIEKTGRETRNTLRREILDLIFHGPPS